MFELLVEQQNRDIRIALERDAFAMLRVRAVRAEALLDRTRSEHHACHEQHQRKARTARPTYVVAGGFHAAGTSVRAGWGNNQRTGKAISRTLRAG